MNNIHKQHSHYFLLFCLTASIILVFFIIKPFLAPLILAGVFAFLFQPIYRMFLKSTKNRTEISVALTTFSAFLLVLLPIGLIGTLIFKESNDLYHSLAGDSDFIVFAENTSEKIKNVLPIPQNFELDLGQYLRQVAGLFASNIGTVFSSIAKILLSVFMFLIAFYFFIKDGHKLKDFLVDMSPLDDSDDRLIVSRLESAVTATVKGTLTIGLIQGALSGIGFAIFGVPNAVLWGSVTAISALMPGIGTSLVIVPAIVYLFLTGNTFGGIGLLIWGLTAVGLIDNLLGPRLVGRGLKIHPLAVFLAVLGGLTFFGPLGFILGPLAMSVCVALFDIYASIRATRHETLQ